MKNTGALYRSTEKTPAVFPEFRDLLPPLSQEQQEALEKDILQNGCYSPLIVDQKLRVVDGHNRLLICQDHEIPYTMLCLSSRMPWRQNSGRWTPRRAAEIWTTGSWERLR